MSRFISARSSQRIVTTISARKPLIKFPLFLNNIWLARPVMEVQILLCICTARRKNEIAASGAQKHFVFAAQTYKKPVGIAAAGAFLIEST
jgi:hypothetical protein